MSSKRGRVSPASPAARVRILSEGIDDDGRASLKLPLAGMGDRSKFGFLSDWDEVIKISECCGALVPAVDEPVEIHE